MKCTSPQNAHTNGEHLSSFRAAIVEEQTRIKNQIRSEFIQCGVDEVQFQKGHRYLTVVYQINADCRRLLWGRKGRTTKTLLCFFKMLGRKRTAGIQFVRSELW